MRFALTRYGTRRRLRRAVVVCAFLLGSVAGQGQAIAQSGATATSAEPGLIARGEYLTRAADCAACHTVRGGKAFAGGLAIALPFGSLYSPNITPDHDTGIGSYTDDQFVRALQDGVARDGRHLYPAFPYPSYALMPREDILAVKAYLFGLTPVAGSPPASHLSFPFDQRWGMVLWNLLFKPGQPFRPDPAKSAEWNRGAYLVQGPGHCGECHTPRNTAMAVDNGQQLAGAVTQGWKAYNITSDQVSGIGTWTDEQLASYLSTGHGDQRSSASGPMGEVLENSLRYLTPADIRAMIVYLRTVQPIRNAPAIEGAPPARQKPGVPADVPPSLGQRIFSAECSNCHGWDGRGIQAPHAALVGSRTVNDPEGTNLVGVLLAGARVRTGSGAIVYMPPFGRAHSDDEIAAVANFVSQRFGNGAVALTAAAVAGLRNPPPPTLPTPLLWGGIAIFVAVLLLVLWGLVRVFGRRRGPVPSSA